MASICCPKCGSLEVTLGANLFYCETCYNRWEHNFMANRIVINRIDDGPISVELNGKIVYALGEFPKPKSEEYMNAYKEGFKSALNVRDKFELSILGLSIDDLFKAISEYQERKS